MKKIFLSLLALTASAIPAFGQAISSVGSIPTNTIGVFLDARHLKAAVIGPGMSYDGTTLSAGVGTNLSIVGVNGTPINGPNFTNSSGMVWGNVGTNITGFPTNIADAQIVSGAAIARSKVANGTPDHIVINSGAGALSSEATLGAARFPALTGEVTTPGGSLATTIAANAVTDTKLRDSAGFSVIGKATTGSGDPADIVAGTDTVFGRIGSGNLGFAKVNTNQISSANASAGQVLGFNGSVVVWTNPPSGGTSFYVGTTNVSNPSLSGTTPAAPTNGKLVGWQTSGTNVSAAIVGNGNASQYLDGTGAYSTPAGGSAAIYFNGTVDTAPNFRDGAGDGTIPPVTWNTAASTNHDLVIGPASATKAGVLTTGSQTVAGDKTFSTSINSAIFSTTAADPADTGALRFGNNEFIRWEASPAGTDMALGVDATEALIFTGTFGALSGYYTNTLGVGTNDFVGGEVLSALGPIKSSGSTAGYVFKDRTSGTNWVWYGSSTIARLYNGLVDIFSSDINGNTSVRGSFKADAVTVTNLATLNSVTYNKSNPKIHNLGTIANHGSATVVSGTNVYRFTASGADAGMILYSGADGDSVEVFIANSSGGTQIWTNYFGGSPVTLETPWGTGSTFTNGTGANVHGMYYYSNTVPVRLELSGDAYNPAGSGGGGGTNYTFDTTQFSLGAGNTNLSIKLGVLETNTTFRGPLAYPPSTTDSTNINWAVGQNMIQGLTTNANFTNTFTGTNPASGSFVSYIVNNNGASTITNFLDAFQAIGLTNYYFNTGASNVTSIAITAGARMQFDWMYINGRYYLKTFGKDLKVTDAGFSSSWDGDTGTAPSRNAVYDWGHVFDTDDNGTVDLVTVTDSTDATSFIAMFDSATGNLAPKTDGKILYDAASGSLTVDGLDVNVNIDDVAGFIAQQEQSNPSTPASGKGRWFVSTTGKPSFIDDAGTVSDLSATGGGGGASPTNGFGITVTSSNIVNNYQNPTTSGSGTTLTIDVATQNTFWINVTNNFVMAAPSNPQPGMKINVYFAQDSTGGWTGTLTNGISGGFMFFDDIGTPILSTTANYVDKMVATYMTNSSPRWYVDSFIRGAH